MFGLGKIFQAFNLVLGLVNKFVPSRDERAGRAKEQRDQAKRAEDARQRMEDTPAGDAESTADDLRKGKF